MTNFRINHEKKFKKDDCIDNLVPHANHVSWHTAFREVRDQPSINNAISPICGFLLSPATSGTGVPKTWTRKRRDVVSNGTDVSVTNSSPALHPTLACSTHFTAPNCCVSKDCKNLLTYCFRKNHNKHKTYEN